MSKEGMNELIYQKKNSGLSDFRGVWAGGGAGQVTREDFQGEVMSWGVLGTSREEWGLITAAHRSLLRLQ